MVRVKAHTDIHMHQGNGWPIKSGAGPVVTGEALGYENELRLVCTSTARMDEPLARKKTSETRNSASRI